MAIRIIMDIDIQNPEEVIKAHKGQIYGLLSDVVLSKESKKKKVNVALANEIVRILKVELPIELEKEIVRANIAFKIVENTMMPEEEE